MGRPDKGRGPRVSVHGAWLPLSLSFLRSEACAKLSPYAVKLMVDLMSQLGWNGQNNGDLCAAMSLMEPRGWASKNTLKSAVAELLEARLLVVTRQGSKRMPHLYAITLWPLDCDMSKLDIQRPAHAQDDWQAGGTKPPTADRPVRWAACRGGR